MGRKRDDFDWLRITEVAPASDDSISRRTLRAALVTTYGRPDPDVLVEELLPQWLGMERELTDSGATNQERQLFYLELDRRLRSLRGRFSIFSSDDTEQPQAYHWLWRYLRLLTVGCDGRATQHSKLWMFHWHATQDTEDGNDDSPQELLQIVVSSANLTSGGLNGQIQAGWSVTLVLEPRRSDTRLKGWGVLPEFLSALGRSSGSEGQKQVRYWMDLLGRAVPPPGATFIASVPGVHSRKILRRSATAWGAAGLAAVDLGVKARADVCILVPTIGHWTQKSLNNWKQWLGGKSDLSLAWLNDRHPWAKFWQLPDKAKSALQEAGVRVLFMPATDGSGDAGPTDADWQSPLHNDHRRADARWCHAKVYRFRRGNGSRVLITSANFSPAAWGQPCSDGGLKIDNFELGVLLRTDCERLGELDEMEWDDVCLCEVQEEPEQIGIVWADASWNGQQIRIAARVSSPARLEKHLAIHCADVNKPQSRSVRWTRHKGLWSANIRWTEDDHIPEVVTLTTSGKSAEAFDVLIADARQPKTDDLPMIPVLAGTDLKALDLRLLEEDYNGGLADDDGGDNRPPPKPPNDKTPVADYRIPAIESARRRWRVIDTWLDRYEEAGGSDTERQTLLRDGERLTSLWKGLADDNNQSSAERAAARAAASAMEARLKGLSP